MAIDTEKHLFLRACYRQPVERTPVWIMRQAGRYLPEYRAVRKNHSFSEMYKRPDLATEVTLQPIDILGVDAAILFSDILVVPEAMGMELHFSEGKGPQFPNPLRDEAALKALHPVESNEDLGFVMEAIRNIRHNLADRVPLIGFAGAPWTLATYMIEGGGSKNFQHAKKWRFARPDLLRTLVEKIADVVIDYCRAQMDAGAQAIQIFDSWAGILDTAGFEEFALAPVRRIIAEIKRPGIPVIYFPKGGMTWLDRVVDCGADVIGVDWTISLESARRITGDRVALQGNMDPTALYAPPEAIREQVRSVLASYGKGHGHIGNLGHGMLPDIPVEHTRAYVEAMKEFSPAWK